MITMIKGTREDYSYSHNTDTSAIHSIVQYTDKAGMTLTETMGYTAHAFRIIIDKNEVEVGSYSFFDWKLHHAAVMRNLGFAVRTAGQQTNTPPTPDELEEGISLLHDSLDRGIPALGWDLFIPEWGIIYGYDDDRRVLRCRDIQMDGDLPYEKLGRGEVTELYVLTVAESQPVDRLSMLEGALRLAVSHARTPYAELVEGSHRNGLAAFDAWIEAFGNRTVDPFGNSVNAGKVADAREFAARFLRELSEQGGAYLGEAERDARVRQIALEAAGQYGIVAERLAELRAMFPFPQGGEPNEDAQAARAIELLRDAKAAEEQGVGQLERLLDALTA